MDEFGGGMGNVNRFAIAACIASVFGGNLVYAEETMPAVQAATQVSAPPVTRVVPRPLTRPANPVDPKEDVHRSARQIHALVVACKVYSVDHSGDWPEKLDAVLDTGVVKAEDNALIDPTDPKKRQYVYHAWTSRERQKLDAAKTPCIWSPVAGTQGPINVGFLDGHVEEITNEALDKLIQDAKAASQ